MQPDISEFSYGFALVSELLHYYQLSTLGAPRFPTQVEEGKEGGYDVGIPRGVPIFLQMKRSECLVRMNAANASALGIPHYRMHLRPLRHSQQHNLLLAWEQTHPEVYYATPLFHTPKELDEAYQSNNVALKSLLIKPSVIGNLPDIYDHHLDVDANGSTWLFCSRTPRKVPSRSVKQILETDIRKAASTRSVELDETYLRDLGDQIIEAYVKGEVRVPIEEPEEERGRGAAERRRARAEEVARRESAVRRKAHEVRASRRPAEYAREVANTLLGCELLLAPAPV